VSWLPPVTYWGAEWGDEWDNADPASLPSWSGWSPDPVPARPLPPRCGRVLVLDGRFERAGEPGDPGDPPRCGRPAGHPRTADGKSGCRSEAAVARYLRADRARQAVTGRRSRAAA
jgi:hypothetical protein